MMVSVGFVLVVYRKHSAGWLSCERIFASLLIKLIVLQLVDDVSSWGTLIQLLVPCKYLLMQVANRPLPKVISVLFVSAEEMFFTDSCGLWYAINHFEGVVKSLACKTIYSIKIFNHHFLRLRSTFSEKEVRVALTLFSYLSCICYT